jgi:hypothetical protein
MRHVLFATLLAVGASTAVSAAAGDNPYLVQGMALYHGLKYEKALQRLQKASEVPDNRPEDEAAIALYTGLCQFSLGRPQDAKASFFNALVLQRELRLPPGSSPKIQAMFEEVRARVPKPAPVAPPEPPRHEEPRPPPPAEVSDAPRQEAPPPHLETATPAPIAPPPPAPSRSFALPITFGVVGLAAVGVGATFGVLAGSNAARANSLDTPQQTADALGKQAQMQALVANAAYTTAGVAAVAALIALLLR